MGKGFGEAQNATNEWYTPRWVFEKLRMAFDLDPASPGQEIVPWVPARHHYTLKENGLFRPWFGNVWLNPPYGPHTPAWLEKFLQHGSGIARVFARTDTSWFHDLACRCDCICYTRGRIQFIDRYGNEGAQPSCGSMLLAIGKDNASALANSGLGTIVKPQPAKIDEPLFAPAQGGE